MKPSAKRVYTVKLPAIHLSENFGVRIEDLALSGILFYLIFSTKTLAALRASLTISTSNRNLLSVIQTVRQ